MDLGILISTMRPMEDVLLLFIIGFININYIKILEKDEIWEFQRLKSEIYEIVKDCYNNFYIEFKVSNLYGVNEMYDEDK